MIFCSFGLTFDPCKPFRIFCREKSTQRDVHMAGRVCLWYCECVWLLGCLLCQHTNKPFPSWPWTLLRVFEGNPVEIYLHSVTLLLRAACFNHAIDCDSYQNQEPSLTVLCSFCWFNSSGGAAAAKVALGGSATAWLLIKNNNLGIIQTLGSWNLLYAV